MAVPILKIPFLHGQETKRPAGQSPASMTTFVRFLRVTDDFTVPLSGDKIVYAKPEVTPGCGYKVPIHLTFE